MSADDREYLIAPWGAKACDTTVLTVELPSRELVVQLEVPTDVLDRTVQLSEQYGISVERALAERLERNRARVSLTAARTADDVTAVQKHLTDAQKFLSGVEELETDDIEAGVKRVCNRELDSE